MLYEVIDTVRHSETLEPLTLCTALYGERGLWVRPAAMFQETVVIDGVAQPALHPGCRPPGLAHHTDLTHSPATPMPAA